MTSTSTLQNLRSERANLWDQMCKLMDTAETEKRPLSGEERATYDRLEKDLDEKGATIDRAEAHAKRAAAFDTVETPGRAALTGPTGRDESPKDQAYAQAFATYIKRGQNALTGEQQQILQTGWIESPSNAGGVGTGAAGGFTVPPAFRNRIVEQVTYVAAMRQLAEVITTDTGASLPWPTVDDTANEGAILGENTQVTEQDFTFGQASLGAYMYTSKMVRLSLQLIQDNAFDVERWLSGALGARIGRVQNRHFTVGTGTAQPLGVITGAPVGVVGATGQTTSVTYDNLVDLVDSIDAAYLGSGNVGFMMSQAARRSLRKLKDGQNRPLWEPSLQAGTPDQLMGYGLTINNYVPAPAASAKSIAFGDFREAYVVRDVSDFALLRLTERFADFLQVGFIGFQRSDGTVQNGSAVRTYQHSAA
jgi:HK97 family phage major capsid protein